MASRGAVGPVIMVALVLAGCTDGAPAPAETVTVTATPSVTETVTRTATAMVTVEPEVHVPVGGYAILLGDGATREDAALAAAFVKFALDPSTVPDGLAFAADGVQLGIMERVYATRTPAELRNASAWEIGSRDDLLFERMGPYSVLEPVRQWVVGQDQEGALPGAAPDRDDTRTETGVLQVNVGRHRGCPYDIEGVPPDVATARQVWLTPVGEWVSCAGRWFAVDLFVVDGEVSAVTVELGSP